ncbi:MAG TPA: hypothetical protein VK680_11075 [Solirubrobacteraceae bacterium]|jgi:hypothetical protein|nr:hypothetical protein [Solirubrobacteraceae bacterium]
MGRFSVHSAALVAAAVLAILPCSALAQVSAGDVSATSAYLKADYASVRAEIQSFPTAIAAVEALATKVQAECPGVLANAPKPAPGTPPSASEAAISEEELEAVFAAAARTERARRARFAHEVAALHWSSSAFTRLVHSQAIDEVEKAAVAPAELCADMRSWLVSGYQSVSVGTERYLHMEAALTAKTERAETDIKRELRPYESAADKRVARKIDTLESAEPPMVKEFLAALGKVGEVLVGSAPASGS